MTAAAEGTLAITEEHLALAAAARRWVADHVTAEETKAALEAEEESLPSFWDALRAQGWLGLHLPVEHGGEGYTTFELCVVLEELGRACAPGPFLPTVITSAAIAALGAEDLGRELLPGLASGTVRGATAFGARPVEAAVGEEGGVVLDGTVTPVLGAGLADVLLIPARCDDRDVWCVLDRAQVGVSVEVRRSLDATRRLATVTFEGVPVAAARLVWGPSATRAVLDVAAVLAGAESVGAMSWCVDTAATHAAERTQFGRPIGQFQAVKHRCAGMLLQLERARSAVWDASRGAPDDEAELAACIVGAVVPEAAFEVAKDCIQVLGGIGYTWEHDAHHYLRRATTLHALAGGAAPWRARVAALALDGVRRGTGDVELPAEADAVRTEVRAFVERVQAGPKETWNAEVARAGYLVPYWPAPWGRGAGAVEQLVIDQEFDRARLRRPHLQVGAWVLPTLIAHGTPQQQQRWIPDTLEGRTSWCQLFSEPGAGSDLASLSMRAVRDDEGGGWRLTGQKVWTTMAHLAQWGLCLARTDPEAPKHEGITAFVVDMASPGIDIRPLRELTGAALFNEVFFDDVFVPDDCVIGAVDEGWEAARTTLANERVSIGSGSSFGPGVESVLALARAAVARGDGPPRSAPVVVELDAVGGLVADAQAIAAMGLRMTLRALSGAKPGAEASVRKLLATEHEQRVQEVGMALLGPDAAADDGDGAAWIAGFLGNRALSIAGGTSDIQRNIVAERLLGLPKDPEPGE